MRFSFTVVVLLSVLLVLTLSSCSKQAAPVETGTATGPTDLPPTGEPAATPAEAPSTDGDLSADAVVDKVGAPLYQGAEAADVVIKDGKTIATFHTTASYKEVKAFYLDSLKTPEWANNGFEMGAMGGDEWEFKSADEAKLVMVKSESSTSKTEIRFTLKNE
jgi:hypothetical protein